MYIYCAISWNKKTLSSLNMYSFGDRDTIHFDFLAIVFVVADSSPYYLRLEVGII